MSDIREQNSEAVEFKNLLIRFVTRWYYFVLAWFFCFIGMYMYLWYATPQYLISGKVLVEDKKSSPLGSSDILEGLNIFKPNKIIENEIEIINSRALIGKALEELEFDVLYKKVYNIKEEEIYKKSPFAVRYELLADSAYFINYYVDFINENEFSLKRTCDFFSLKSDEERSQKFKFGDTINTRFGSFIVLKKNEFDFTDNNKQYSFAFRSLKDNIAFYQKALKISLASKTSTVLVLSIEYPLPEKGEDFINKLTQVYIQGGVDEKNKVASNTLDFIKGRLGIIFSDLTGIESGIEKYKSDKGIADISEEAKIFLQTIKYYDEQLSTINIQLNFIEYIENQMKSDNALSDAVSLSVAGINDPVLVELLGSLTKLETESQKIILTTNEENPLLKIYTKQIADIKKTIIQNVGMMKNNLLISRQSLNKIVAGFEGQIKQIPKTERELIDIQRQQNIKEKLYLYLLQKQEETSIALASTVSDNRIIDMAKASDKPIAPVKRNVAIIAFIIGLIVPAGIISLLDYFNDTVMSREQIEAVTSSPIIGTVGKSATKDIIAINEKAKSAISEEFRAIRTNLQYISAGNERKVILVTSSLSGEGKTFISLNLGMTLAISGKKTVVLEIDLRKPKLSTNLSLNNEVGISNFLVDACSETETIKNSGLHQMLDIVGSGPIPPNPAELLLSDRLDQLISFLKTKYDYILIDSPPVGLVSDSLVISKFADLSIYIIRQGYTTEKNLLTVKSVSENNQLKRLCIIFNDVTNKYGYYGYSYGYGYYEELKPKKRKFFDLLFFWKK